MHRNVSSVLGSALVLASLAAGGSVLAQDARDTLRVAMYSKAPSRGNVYGVPNTWPSMFWWEAIYDSFVRVDDKTQLRPHAAESWELVNNTTWRVKFKPNVEFSNGRKNDAANVVAIFDYLHSEQGKSASIIRNVKLASYKALDANTVEFVTQEPDPLLVAKFAGFYTADMKAWAEMGLEAFTARPVTSGPFKVVSWNDNEMVAAAHDKSWRAPKAKNLRMTEVPEPPARVAALESGQSDIIINMGPDDIARIRGAGHQAIIDPAPYVVSLALFTEDFANKWNKGGKTPFADRRVRQAVNYAIDRNALVKDLFGGITEPSGQPAAPQTFGYNPDVKPYPHDPAKARALLAEAGYPNGFSILMETQTGAIPQGREVLQAIANDLGKVGVKTDVRSLPFAEWVGKLIGKKWEGESTSFSMFHSPMIDVSVPFVWYSCQAPQRFTCVEELEPLISAQAKEMDRSKRQAILRDLMKKSNEEALSITVMDGKDITGVAKRVRGFGLWHRVVLYENISVDG
ncbi:MAG: hypothetical protein FJX65_01770 [Alphaproteobacteria bacterium]|nr:hypothetical protein [Alphaproteobacteria bacterium]